MTENIKLEDGNVQRQENKKDGNISADEKLNNSTSSDSREISPKIYDKDKDKKLAWEEMTQEQKIWHIFKKKAIANILIIQTQTVPGYLDVVRYGSKNNPFSLLIGKFLNYLSSDSIRSSDSDFNAEKLKSPLFVTDISKRRQEVIEHYENNDEASDECLGLSSTQSPNKKTEILHWVLDQDGFFEISSNEFVKSDLLKNLDFIYDIYFENQGRLNNVLNFYNLKQTEQWLKDFKRP